MTTVLPVPVQAAPVDAPAPSVPVPAPAASADEGRIRPVADPRWTFHRLWETLGQPLRATHIASGLTREYNVTLSFIEREGMPSTWLDASFRLYALNLLDDPATPADLRAAAAAYVQAENVVEAVCHCGGLLTTLVGRVWRHVGVCEWCLDAPSMCAPGSHDMCGGPAPAKCGHCRRANENQRCGCDKAICGSHDCDTALVA